MNQNLCTNPGAARTRAATAAALAANLIFGLAFLFSRLAFAVTEPFVLLAYRFVLALIVMTAYALIRKRRIPWRNPKFKQLLLLGVCDPTIYFVFENYGLLYANASFAGIMIAVIPVTTVLASAAFLREPPTKWQVLFTLLSIAGVAVISAHQSAGGVVTLRGILLLAGAVLAATCFNVMTRKLSADFSPFERTYVTFLVSGIAFAALAVFTHLGDIGALIAPARSGIFWVAVAYLGVCSSVLSYMLANYSNTYLPLSRTAIFANLATVASVAAGVIVLREPFDLVTAVSAAVIIISAFCAQRC